MLQKGNIYPAHSMYKIILDLGKQGLMAAPVCFAI